MTKKPTMEHFESIKAYLSRLRKWEAIIEDDKKQELSFHLNSRYESKWFHLIYVDSEYELQGVLRPYYHYYYCHFSEENVPDARSGQFITLFDDKLFQNEDEVIHWIKNKQRVGR